MGTLTRSGWVLVVVAAVLELVLAVAAAAVVNAPLRLPMKPDRQHTTASG